MVEGGLVAAVSEGSLSEEMGIRSGDEVLSIDGHVLRDVIDYQYYAAEEDLEMVVRRKGVTRHFSLRRKYGEDLGIEFTSPVFNGMRHCSNQCEFCFVNQMPPGLRRSLYVKDDDYRYSFLYGNFITLSNLTDNDWVRLAQQRLSPLYVSVHATDAAIRRRLLRNPTTPDIVPQLIRLGNLGIKVHAQIVVCPGVNDGDVLEQTITDLVGLWPVVVSIAIVPVGLTRFCKGKIRTLAREDAYRLIERYGADQSARYRCLYGVGLVYLADEVYFLAGEPMPAAHEYDDYPQLENGVGLTRLFLDEWDELRAEVTGGSATYANVAIATGTLFAPLMDQIAGEMERVLGVGISVHPVVNRFFGSMVTVAGLLTGQDVVHAFRGKSRPDLLLLPGAMFDNAGRRRTIDDWDQDRIAEEVGTTIMVAGTVREMQVAVVSIQQDRA
ncbi:MAG: DUF512 domain-containing protein [Anaerolineae bacterium]|nr:DUF512 domain-containing protein [Anaerolineae bacterium]